VRRGPRALAARDLDGDGIADLVVASFATNIVSVLRGRGDGTFAGHVDSRPAPDPLRSRWATSNGNGSADIVTANGAAPGTVSILAADGAGGFSRADYLVGGTPSAVALGDLDGDGAADIVVANGDALAILLDARGGLLRFSRVPAGPNPSGVALADLDGDGHLDVIVANDVDPGLVTVLLVAATGPSRRPCRSPPPASARGGRRRLQRRRPPRRRARERDRPGPCLRAPRARRRTLGAAIVLGDRRGRLCDRRPRPRLRRAGRHPRRLLGSRNRHPAPRDRGRDVRAARLRRRAGRDRHRHLRTSIATTFPT